MDPRSKVRIMKFDYTYKNLHTNILTEAKLPGYNTYAYEILKNTSGKRTYKTERTDKRTKSAPVPDQLLGATSFSQTVPMCIG
jgi:hypothetical protein